MESENKTLGPFTCQLLSLCPHLSDTANIRQSTHALSQLENLHYKLGERKGSTGDERKGDREGEKWIGAERGKDTGRIRNKELRERDTDEDRGKEGDKGPREREKTYHSAISLFHRISYIPLYYVSIIQAISAPLLLCLTHLLCPAISEERNTSFLLS